MDCFWSCLNRYVPCSKEMTMLGSWAGQRLIPLEVLFPAQENK